MLSKQKLRLSGQKNDSYLANDTFPVHSIIASGFFKKFNLLIPVINAFLRPNNEEADRLPATLQSL